MVRVHHISVDETNRIKDILTQTMLHVRHDENIDREMITKELFVISLIIDDMVRGDN